jgi:hypothetical protein
MRREEGRKEGGFFICLTANQPPCGLPSWSEALKGREHGLDSQWMAELGFPFCST